MGKKKASKNSAAAEANQQPTEIDVPKEPEEVTEGFFRRHWNGAKRKFSDNKKVIFGAMGGAVATAAAAAGLYYLGSQSEPIEWTNLEEDEGGEVTESPQDE